MEFDAFDAGIELGGLRDRDDIRLLVCYTLKNVDVPMTKMMMNEILQQDGLANYFEVGEAIEDLLKTGSLITDIIDDDECIILTDKGRESVRMLQHNLPKTVREKAINSAIRLTTRARNEKENKIDVKKEENGGYTITFTMLDGESELMKLSVYVVDSAQLQQVRNNFMDDPIGVYSAILTSLTVE